MAAIRAWELEIIVLTQIVDDCKKAVKDYSDDIYVRGCKKETDWQDLRNAEQDEAKAWANLTAAWLRRPT